MQLAGCMGGSAEDMVAADLHACLSAPALLCLKLLLPAWACLLRPAGRAAEQSWPVVWCADGWCVLQDAVTRTGKLFVAKRPG